jgi:DNA-binding NarL/FixJ family response regulator
MYLAQPSCHRELPYHPLLTRHESGILHRIVQGGGLREIAAEKGIAHATARVHGEHIRDKLETNSIRAAAALILQMARQDCR